MNSTRSGVLSGAMKGPKASQVWDIVNYEPQKGHLKRLLHTLQSSGEKDTRVSAYYVRLVSHWLDRRGGALQRLERLGRLDRSIDRYTVEWFSLWVFGFALAALGYGVGMFEGDFWGQWLSIFGGLLMGVGSMVLCMGGALVYVLKGLRRHECEQLYAYEPYVPALWRSWMQDQQTNVEQQCAQHRPEEMALWFLGFWKYSSLKHQDVLRPWVAAAVHQKVRWAYHQMMGTDQRGHWIVRHMPRVLGQGGTQKGIWQQAWLQTMGAQQAQSQVDAMQKALARHENQGMRVTHAKVGVKRL